MTDAVRNVAAQLAPGALITVYEAEVPSMSLVPRRIILNSDMMAVALEHAAGLQPDNPAVFSTVEGEEVDLYLRIDGHSTVYKVVRILRQTANLTLSFSTPLEKPVKVGDTVRFLSYVLRFHDGKSAKNDNLYWGYIAGEGIRYSPWPIEVIGFEMKGDGRLPRPKMSISNVGGVLTRILGQGRQGDATTTNLPTVDLIGSRVVRRRTFARYLNPENFPDNVNPYMGTANPTTYVGNEFSRDVFIVDRRTTENPVSVGFELISPLDTQGISLPRRQINRGFCMYRYRGDGCSYNPTASGAPGYFDVFDKPTSDPAKDVCGKRLSSCKARFGGSYGPDGLPFGGVLV